MQLLAAQVEVLHRVSRGSRVSLDLDQLLQGLCKLLLKTFVFGKLLFSNLRSEAGGSSAPSSASPSARITSDMFQAAMLQVSVIYSLQIKILTINPDLLHLLLSSQPTSFSL